MDSIEIIIVGSIIGLAFIITALYFVIKAMYMTFVKRHSIFLSTLDDINKKYTFYPRTKYDQKHTYDNENFFHDISAADYLIYQLQFLSFQVLEQIKHMYTNQNRFREYMRAVESIKIRGQYNKSTKGWIVKLLNHYEKIIFKKKIQSPDLEYSITVTLYLSKINGQVYAKKSQTFRSPDILKWIERLNNKSGTFYRDRYIWESLCRVERGKVSNKMRFAVYKRDGYRCRYCHRTERSARLEVDHIIPISKGGKSTFDNLQTLCHECNVRKGNHVY